MKPITVLSAVAIAAAGATLAAPPAFAHGRVHIENVPFANARFGVQNNVLTPSARQTSVAWGSLPLTNPDTANGVTHYGYNTSLGGPLTQAANEANKTEPDKNVYLVFNGKHYLYQGHELGPRGYVTRVNLDETDPAKRVTLISDVDANGAAFPTIDGITWDPFTKQLLITAESKAPKGGVFAISLDANGDAVDGKAVALPALGSGGYEGIQNDSAGNLWIVEDIGGAAASGGKVPNSYVYRFVPTDKADLTKGGKLQALQIKRANGKPATATELQANPSDPFIADLHKRGASFDTAWVTVHAGTTEAFDATAAAKGGVRHPAEAARERRVPARHRLPRVLLHRDRRHLQPQHAARPVRRRLPDQAGQPVGRPGQDRAGRPGRSGTHRPGQHRLPRGEHPARRRGRRRPAARSAQRARFGLRLRAGRPRRHPGDPDRPFPGRRSGRIGGLRRGGRAQLQRRGQRDHRYSRLRRRSVGRRHPGRQGAPAADEVVAHLLDPAAR